MTSIWSSIRPAGSLAAIVLMALAPVSAAGARAAQRPAGAQRPVLRWSTPRQVDRGRTKVGLTRAEQAMTIPAVRTVGPASALLHGGIPITGVSCPTASLCVVADLNGNVLTTRAPAQPRSWKRTLVDAVAPLNGISCSSLRFCAAIDTMGGVVTTTNPTGGRAAWRRVTVRPPVDVDGHPDAVPLSAVSCASAHLCISGDDAPGEIMTSTNPSGGRSAWRDGIGLGRRRGADGLISVSCASTRFCAGIGDQGVYATTAPLAAASTAVAVTSSLESIACGSRRLCVAVAGGQLQGGTGGVWRSVDPGARHPRWTASQPDDAEQFAVACHRRTLCVATDSAGRVTMSRHPARRDPAWQTRRVDGTRVLAGIACPTASLCVAGDTFGYVVVGRS